MRRRSIASLVLLLLCMAGASWSQVRREPGDVSKERLLTIGEAPGDWLTGGRDYEQSYFSPLAQIDRDTVAQLGFAWQYDIDTTDGFEATPIVVDGVMYASGPKGAVYALDARTGNPLWTFTPEIDDSIMQKLCCGVVNRGVSVWKGKVYVASLDGYLYALNAATGTVAWQADTITDRQRGYSITGAPQVADKVVVIGNGGAELDARGYVTAYDLETGKQAWRFFTVPGDPAKGFEHPELAMAAKSWDPKSRWDVGLGGTAWDSMVWDPKLNILYVGTGNAAPWYRKLRSPAGGDNLFLSSILAIDPESGRLLWHYQTTPAESWDYTATQKMILADIRIAGTVRQVLMQAPKNGFFYVLDRKTGELLSAKPYVPVNWASHVDMATGRPVETGQGDYSTGPKLIFPGSAGGHNWHPMSFSPDTGLVYIPAYSFPMIYALPAGKFAYQKGGANTAVSVIFPTPGPFGLDGEAAKDLPPIAELAKGQPDYRPRGFLLAWDPVAGKEVWRVDTSGAWVGQFFASWNGGGVMSTGGGLVFQGRSTGELAILDARSGKQLGGVDVGTSMMAAPMTYRVDGEQYVAIMAGLGGALGRAALPGTAAYTFGNRGRIVAFKLGGGAVPQRAMVRHDEEILSPPPVQRRGSAAQHRAGAQLFQRNCAVCHAAAGGKVPDLSRMSAQTHKDFMAIVMQGSRAAKGMGNFSSVLSLSDADLIHMFAIEQQWKTYEAAQKTPAPHSTN